MNAAGRQSGSCAAIRTRSASEGQAPLSPAARRASDGLVSLLSPAGATDNSHGRKPVDSDRTEHRAPQGRLRRGTNACFVAVAALAVAGCQSPRGPIFPQVNPPIEWPRPPDIPRIRYIGELRGEANLGVKPTAWETLQATVSGPRPKVEFSRPTAVAIAGQRVFVADAGLAVVHLLDLDTREYETLTGSSTESFELPIDLAVADDTLVVVDRKRAAFELFDLSGEWRRTLRFPEITAPTAVAWDTERETLWLVDAQAHACFECNDLKTVRERFGGRGGAPGQLNFPSAIAVSPNDGLVVADAMNFRVQAFNADGTPRVAFGQKGDAAGDFSRPRGVAVDSAGHIYVLDNQFENVQVFDRDGRLLMAFGGGGDRPGEFSLPSGITIDDRDRIWIADSYNHRVQVFQYLTEETP